MSRRTPRGYPTSSSPGPTTPGRSELGSRSSPAPAPFTTDSPRQDDDIIDEAAEFRRRDEVEVDDESDEGEDLIIEGMERDYVQRPDLDQYDEEALDRGEYGDISFEERRAADAVIEERQARQREELKRRRARLPAALLAEEEEAAGRPSVRRRRREAEEAAGEEAEINLEEFHGRLIDWITNPAARGEIARQLRYFLMTFEADGHRVYISRINSMASENRMSLEVSYVHLSQAVQLLAVWIADEPKEMLKIFDEVAMNVTREYFPQYDTIIPEVYVRITGLPIADSLRDLRRQHLGGLIRVSGVVTRRSEVFPYLKQVKYDCVKCGFVLGPFVQATEEKIKVGSCPACQSRGPFSVNQELTVYTTHQKMTLQESPGSVPPGRVPRTMDIAMFADLIDSCRPGEEVDITGVYTHSFERGLNIKFGFPAFATLIEANYVVKKHDVSVAFNLTAEDENEIMKLSRDPNITERIIESFAPSIYGQTEAKTALTLSLFGGVRKDVRGKHRLRGDINVLMVGDPGTAKSQFLKYVTTTAYRAVFATGQGASGVGLTASVHKDPITKSWALEGGAMVLADQGVCIIDEFDKMTDQDRVSIHEAMEQQSISVSKAGIVTTLQARCAVIAAANPVQGRYDPSAPLMTNVDLTEPILSRFDVVCLMRDVVDPVVDERLARHVTKTHDISHPEKRNTNQTTPTDDVRVLPSGLTTIPQDMLRKYILFAHTRVTPKLPSDMDKHPKITEFYTQLRVHGRAGGIVVTVRLVESIVRLAEASARIRLSEIVNDDDFDRAISVVLTSFIASQKYSMNRTLTAAFARFLPQPRDNDDLLLHTLEDMFKRAATLHTLSGYGGIGTVLDVQVPVGNFEEDARKVGIHSVTAFLKSRKFGAHNFVVEEGMIKMNA